MKFTMLLLFLNSVFFISCNSGQDHNSTQKNNRASGYKIETELKEFLKENPTWNNNDVSKENFYELLAKEFNPKIKSGILEELPFEFAGVEKYEEKGKIGYLGIMNFDKGKQNSNTLASKFGLSILIFLDRAAVDTLKQGNIYYIKGDFKSFQNDKYLILETIGQQSKEIDYFSLPTERIKVTEIKNAN
ncbi:MAG: hypothetical protein ACTHML_19995 [Ginsengibacter sp.]